MPKKTPKPVTYGAAIAFIGSPNVGKSTLLNTILGKKISIVSDKPQTTRDKILGIHTVGDRQLIFVDTPGIGKPIRAEASRINRIAEQAKHEVDILVWVMDARKGLMENDLFILRSLASLELPIVAVLNKSDLTGTAALIPLVQDLSEKYPFLKEFIPVSGKEGTNVDRLLEVLSAMAPENPFIYGKDELTSQTDEQIVSEFIREQVYINTEKELPYSTEIQIDSMTTDKSGVLQAEATVLAENDRHRRILIGENAQVIKQIRIFGQKRLKEYFGKPVKLQLWVKVKPGASY